MVVQKKVDKLDNPTATLPEIPSSVGTSLEENVDGITFDQLDDPTAFLPEFRSPVGTPLAEVLSVTINIADGEERDLYGTIKVVDDMGTLCIYDMDSEYTEYVNQSDSLSLSNVERAISAASGGFTVELDLKDKNGDIEFILQSFSWAEKSYHDYDKVLIENVVGKGGSAEVCYIVHSVALEAVIMAQFVKGGGAASEEQLATGDGAASEEQLATGVGAASEEQLATGDGAASEEQLATGDGAASEEQLATGDGAASGEAMDCDEVYDAYFHGNLVAYYKGFNWPGKDQKRYGITLFNEDDEQPMAVRDKHILYMPISVLSVPSYVSLSIEGELYGRLSDGSGNMSWRGEVDFLPEPFSGCLHTKTLESKYGVIRLSVKWLDYYSSIESLKEAKRAMGLKV